MAKTKITQLDLFSGIGGFHLGFERAGYEVKSYFSEIDKHAVAVYKQQFKDAEYVGSVTDVRGAELPRIDLITFGSPCQDFSLAGKREGMQGDRSSLVLEAIRLINECRPSVFIWENVKGTFSSNAGADFWAIIQAFTNIGGYRLEWQLLNTSWVLPQNRERLYVVGYSTTPGGDWRGVFPIGEEYAGFDERTREAANVRALVSGAKSGGRHSTMTLLKVKSATSKGYEVATEGDSINLSQPNSETRRGRVGKGKAQTLETSCNQAVVEPMVGDYRMDEGWRIRENGVTPTITQHCSRDGISNGVKVIEPKYEIGDWRKDTGYRPRNNGLVPTLRSNTETNKPILTTPQYRIRRLTPIECERLQGFPDNHTEYGNYDGEVKKISNTQRYKQCGNAVTVDIVALVAEAVKPLFK